MESERERQLIIAADDYGIRDASMPILDLARSGLVDRVAVLARFVTPEDAEKLLATGVTIDIHLELTRLLGRGEYEGDSFVRRISNFLWRLLRGDLSRSAVEQEWCGQIESFREKFGRLPDGANSHEHVHFFPPIFRSFLDVARKYDIGYVRFGSHDTLGCLRWHGAQTVISALHRMNRQAWRKSPLPTSEYLVSGDWIDDPKDFLMRLPEGKTEIVVHPERPKEASMIRLLRGE